MKDLLEIQQNKYKELVNHPKFSAVCNTKITAFPKPFPLNPANIKAIVLGADPTNPEKKELSFVFGLEYPGSPYFSSILKNLDKLDLSLDNIYVQNLCPNYFKDVTDKNDDYVDIAEQFWLRVLKTELDSLFSSDIPVLVTAWKPLIVVAPNAKKYKNAKNRIYNEAIIFEENLLNRPVVALFRGGRREGYNGYYDLNIPEYANYLRKIYSLIHSNLD